MCGICGQLSFDGKPAQARETEAMVRTLDHRGPDDRGVYAHGPASIGIARLKVIDLETGHQPVRNEDGSVWCVLNGEIYNYRELRETLSARGHYFQTQSDTETIVHLYEEYGAALAEHLRGMFAIALWDQSRQQLLLIRDRLGVKPLYYYLDAGRLVFGSELKALLAAGIPREVDPQAADDYLTHGYVPGEGSIFRNVHKLLPAHTLLIQRSGSRELSRYWDLLDPRWDAEHSAASDPAERAQATWERLKEAVRYRLVSDVPIGVLLSGGIDSTAIVAAMRAVTSQPIKTFTVGFEDESYDESGLARLTAERFETEHYELVAQIQASEIVPSYIHHLDEPYAESSAIPIYYVSRLAREHITVALGGDGGDELFGGYNHYAASRYMEWYKKLPRALSRGLVPWAVGQLPVSHRRASFDYLAKRFVSAVELSPEQAQLKWLEVIADDVKQRLYGPALRDRSEALPAFRYYEQHLDQARRQEGINRLMFMDSRIYLPDGILTKVDRMSMAHSLETRGPFLDHKLVEFGHRLPCGVKMRGLTRKYLLKQLLRGRVPRQVLSQKKMGFVLPLARWLCGDLRELLCDTLSADRLRRTGYFDPAAVEHLINRHLARREDHSKTLWSLLVFQLWLDRYVTERAPS